MKKSEYNDFEALTSLFINIVKKKKYKLVNRMLDFYAEEFLKIRDKSDSEDVLYPEAYYDFIYKAHELLASLKDKQNSLIEHYIAGNVLLLGEGSDKCISKRTFKIIWDNFLTSIEYGADSYFLLHWKTASWYYHNTLKSIDRKYDNKYLKVLNELEINKRDQQRREFMNFHYMLGGLLLYVKKYHVIDNFFNYTNNQPPEYFLLPKTMDEIFQSLIYFSDYYGLRHPFISVVYPYPEQTNSFNNGNVKQSISSYLALLFLRQYRLFPYLTTDNFLSQPTLPESKSEIQEWIDTIQGFQLIVQNQLNDIELLKRIDLDFITEEWCVLNHKKYPLDFLNILIKSLESKYEDLSFTSILYQPKIDKFVATSLKIIEKALDPYLSLNNKIPDEIQTENSLIKGLYVIYDKDAFIEYSEVSHLTYDSLLGNLIARDISEDFPNFFRVRCRKSYLLNQEDIFKAIDRLNLDKDYIILNFGLNTSFYSEYLNVDKLSKTDYKGIRIIDIETRDEPSLFILRYSDMPEMNFLDIDTNRISRYSLASTMSKYRIFASVIDLATAKPEVEQEVKRVYKKNEIRDLVLLCIDFLLEIKWKKELEMIQLREYTPYITENIPVKLEDVKRT